MSPTRQLNITLPDEMADAVQAKVAAGEYASESDVVREGLNFLLARGGAVEHWLRTDVGAAYDALQAERGRAIDLAEVKRRLSVAQEERARG